jgi:uncharacterized protein Yka (UPF0111/DUF47 family)
MDRYGGKLVKFNILDFLLPRETKFYKLFIDQTDVLIEAGHQFKNLALDITTLTDDTLKARVTIIKDCERRGDDVEKLIISELNQTFITPFDREDIHHIAMNIERALDILTSITNKIEIYGIKQFPQNIIKFSELIVEVAETLKKMFGDMEKKRDIENHFKNIHKLEHNADYLFHISVGDLFKQEKDPIQIIKIKEVYEHLETVVDAIDHVGKLARNVLIKHG